MAGKRVWVGLDVSCETTRVCIVDRAGSVLRQVACRTCDTSVRAALKGYGPSSIEAIAVEAGSLSTHLSRKLLARSYPLVLVETRSTSKFLAYNRNKTDTNDARGLAELVRLGTAVTTNVRLKTIETQRLRTKLALRHKVMQQRVALQSVLRSIFRLYGRPLRTVSKMRTAVETAVSQILKEDQVDLQSDVTPLLAMIEQLEAYLKQLDDELIALARENPVCCRFMEVPGIGPICALSFYSAIEAPERFQNSRNVGAYLGLTPKVAQSGQLVRLGRISKMGNRLTRMHLNLAAAVLLFTTKREMAIRDWGLAIAERRGKGRARTAVARKLAVVLHALWRDGTHFEPYPKHHPSPA